MSAEKDETVFSLRLPRDLYLKIIDVATKQRRSVNSQIIVALDAHAKAFAAIEAAGTATSGLVDKFANLRGQS